MRNYDLKKSKREWESYYATLRVNESKGFSLMRIRVRDKIKNLRVNGLNL